MGAIDGHIAVGGVGYICAGAIDDAAGKNVEMAFAATPPNPTKPPVPSVIVPKEFSSAGWVVVPAVAVPLTVRVATEVAPCRE